MQRPALHRRRTPQREEKLASARRAVGLVGKVAVIDARDRKHPNEVEKHARPDAKPTPADPDRAQAAEVNNGQRHTTRHLGLVRRCAHGFGRDRGVVGVKPLKHAQTESL